MKNSNDYTPFEDHAQEKNIASPEALEKNLREWVESIIVFCKQDHCHCAGRRADGQETFCSLEKELFAQIYHLGCLCLQLLMACAHAGFDYTPWLQDGRYRLRKEPVVRTIKSLFGEVRYWRCYLVRKNGRGGFYPLDAVLGLTTDGFSPWVVSLCTKLATRMSFSAAKLVFSAFCNWSPSTEAIEYLVLGLGREAGTFMEQHDPPQDEGDVLVIEVDGKATPTATEKELKQRRGKRKKNGHAGRCQRHRGKAKRKARSRKRKGKKKRRKRGDKSKNGRSITLVVMYTLKRGKDGLLHGPKNKTIWGSYASRNVMFAWIRRQATKRGFPPGTNKRVHFAMDGEVCLKKNLQALFPDATFSLDIHHLEEKLWDVGRTYHQEGSDELHDWVDGLRFMLYEGWTGKLLEKLRRMKKRLSPRANRDQAKLEALNKVIKYMETRLDMMEYKKYLDEDLPIASGIIEGAARYVVGERMDCAGMRWIPERAEALLHLRCIELNGDWDNFIQWDYARRKEKMMRGEKVQIRTSQTINISDPNYMVPKELENAA